MGICRSKPEPEEPPPPPDSCGKKFLRFLCIYWRAIFSIIWPLIWLPVLLLYLKRKAFRCLYLVLVMAGYWVTECIPLAVTSSMPIVFFPIMGILGTEDVCMQYFKATNFMFIGGIMIALAIEHSGLHERIALLVILVIGCSPRKLHFGIMTITMLMSWWMSNAACTSMMCPIILAVLEEMEKQGMGSVYLPVNEEDADSSDKRKPSDFTLAYFLSAAYSSTIGGCVTLVGTPTNLTYRGIFETAYPRNVEGINFTKFIAFNAPVMLILNILTWLVLEVMYLGLFRKRSENYKIVQKADELKDVAADVLKTKFKDLGRMSWHETGVLLLFIITILLWLFRSPGFMPGWAQLMYAKVKKGDASVAFFTIILMFLIPARLTCKKASSDDPEEKPKKRNEGLLTWNVLSKKVPWGFMFLLGGGFAIAAGAEKSRMNSLVGTWLSELKVLPIWIVMSLFAIIASFMTELSANVAIGNIVIPISINVANELRVNGLYLSYPTAVACSFAFMLPVGTPCNAIAAGYVNIPTSQMMKAGFIISWINIILYLVAWQTWGTVIYDFSTQTYLET